MTAPRPSVQPARDAAGADPAAQAVRVVLGARSYDVVVGDGLIDRLGAQIAPVSASRRAILVTDETVAGLYLDRALAGLAASGIQAEAAVLPPGEATKDFRQLEGLLDHVLAARPERSMPIVALGGGVIGDLAGFAAAILLRGLPFIQVPTTLLAQVDSSVGGKTAINSRYGKNLIGAFHQPLRVVADIGALDTQPRRDLLAGYAEIVKYGLISDPAFFAWLDSTAPALIAGDRAARRQAVLTSCTAKAAVVAADERESGERALLNLGHTFGHALEAEVGYGGGLLHGEGVAIGMVMAFDLSVRLGLCPPADAAHVRRHLATVGLPVRPPAIQGVAWKVDVLLARMAQDKKVQDGRITFVLARGIGKAFLARDVETEAVRDLLADSLAG